MKKSTNPTPHAGTGAAPARGNPAEPAPHQGNSTAPGTVTSSGHGGHGDASGGQATSAGLAHGTATGSGHGNAGSGNGGGSAGGGK